MQHIQEFSCDLKHLDQQIKDHILPQLPQQGIVFLEGEMGTGKTTLVSKIAALLGADQQVGSPTYSLLHEYQATKTKIYHLDLYRLNHVEEIFDIGWEEIACYDGIIFVEWPQLLTQIGETPDLTIMISASGENRTYILKK